MSQSHLEKDAFLVDYKFVKDLVNNWKNTRRNKVNFKPISRTVFNLLHGNIFFHLNSSYSLDEGGNEDSLSHNIKFTRLNEKITISQEPNANPITINDWNKLDPKNELDGVSYENISPLSLIGQKLSLPIMGQHLINFSSSKSPELLGPIYLNSSLTKNVYFMGTCKFTTSDNLNLDKLMELVKIERTLPYEFGLTLDYVNFSGNDGIIAGKFTDFNGIPFSGKIILYYELPEDKFISYNDSATYLRKH